MKLREGVACALHFRNIVQTFPDYVNDVDEDSPVTAQLTQARPASKQDISVAPEKNGNGAEVFQHLAIQDDKLCPGVR